MTLEHLGIAVRDAEAAIALFSELLGARPYKEEVVEREGVRTIFFGDGGAAGRAPKIELLAVTSPDSPVARFLERRGPGLHHVAFQVPDLAESLARLSAAGFEPVSAEPTRGADGKRVAFLHPRGAGGVLVELCEAAPPFETIAVPVDGGELAARVGGPADGPPLVLLHGILGSTATMTEPLARRLAADYRVVALDFRGHGRSTAAGPLSVERLSDDLVHVLDATGVKRPHVFGYSLGAAVALAMAWRRPERVGRLALLGTNVQWLEEEARATVAEMTAAGDDPDFSRVLVEAHGEGRWRSLLREAVAFVEALPGRPLADEALREITAPCLVIHGDRDRTFDMSHALHLRRTLPDARLWVVPGADHRIGTVGEAALANALADFFA